MRKLRRKHVHEQAPTPYLESMFGLDEQEKSKSAATEALAVMPGRQGGRRQERIREGVRGCRRRSSRRRRRSLGPEAGWWRLRPAWSLRC
eukprot:10026890-Heterocapsa_arctica.AAC.1